MDSRPTRTPVVETVSSSSLEARQRHWSVREEEISRLNPDLDTAHIESEEEVVFWRINPNYSGLSVNRPNRGRLYNGEIMPSGSGWIVRDERFSFGATQTITGLIQAVRATLAAHEEPGQDLLIADISRRSGGYFPPHSSHQSGRDVDVTYYRNTLDPPTFTRTSSSELDAARTWTFLRTLILEHRIIYAFIDRRLQIQLFRHAEQVGEHPAWLAQIFEYGPRGLRNSRGIVREEPGHDDHMHIRFPCTPNDIRCRQSYK
jgi:murein endopeptidase